MITSIRYLVTHICIYLFTKFNDSFVNGSNILRLDKCGKHSGIFDDIHTNSRLNVDRSIVMRNIRIKECIGHCIYHKECKSISYSENESLCLLHSQRSDPDKKNLEKIDGWMFYQSTDKVQRKSGPYCTKYNPCKFGRCEDQCESPGYKCECDNCYFGVHCDTHGLDFEWSWSEWSVWSIPFLEQGTRSRKAILKNKSEENNFANCGGVLSEIGKCTSEDNCPLVLASYYTNVRYNTIEDLERNGKFEETPDYQKIFNKISIPDVEGDYIAVRLTTYFLSPETGVYMFRTYCNNECKLYLSINTNPANKVQIAYQQMGTYLWYPAQDTDYLRDSDQTSDPVDLIKGNAYYFEVILYERNLIAFVSIGVVLPDGTFDAPITSNYLTTIKDEA